MAFVKVEMIAGKAQRKEHESGGDKTEKRIREGYDETGGSNHSFDWESEKLNYKRDNSHLKHSDRDYQLSSSEDEVFNKNCRRSSALSFHVECASNDKIQLQQEGNEKRIEWKENAASVGTAVEPKSDMQNLRSAYLYDRDPLRDPRFTHLVDQLVPLRTSLSVDRAKMADAKRRAKERLDVICFKDICLNETCRLVYRIMSKAENSYKD